jgi:two-component system, NarL family, response regulator LiaR
MDLPMPIMDGRSATETIHQQLPEVELIALTSVLNHASVSDTIRSGAIGYLLKNSDADALRRAIQAAGGGKVHLSPEAAARLVKEVIARLTPSITQK